MNERAAWLERRRNHIGASDLATLIPDLPSWGTPFQLWADKVHGIDQPATLKMRHGQYLEPWLLELLDEHCQIHAKPWQGMVLHADGLHSCTPDGLGVVIEDEGREVTLVETKVTNRRQWVAAQGRAWDWADGPPPWVRVQCLLQMACANADKAVVAVYFADTGEFAPANPKELPLWTVERDDVTLEPFLATSHRWWARWVQPWKDWQAAGSPSADKPEPHPTDGSKACTATLARIWPTATRTATMLPIGAAATVEDYLDYSKAATEATAARRAIGNELKALLDGADDGWLPGQDRPAFTWRANKTGTRVLRVTAAPTEPEEQPF